MKTAISVLAALLAACSRPYTPREGDLLFQLTPPGGMTDAITEVTSGVGGAAVSHVAMVLIERGDTCVIEAAGGRGVVITPIGEFLAASARIGGRPAVIAGRLRGAGARTVSHAVRRARGFLGQPYDDAFLPCNGAMYCSELIYESYREEPLLRSKRMTFRTPQGDYPPFWREHFARIGLPIPEGVRGTNPGDMSRDPAVRIVGRYF